MKGRSHENDVFTPCGRSVHTGEKNGWMDGRYGEIPSMSIRIRDLKSYTVEHGDSENISFM